MPIVRSIVMLVLLAGLAAPQTQAPVQAPAKTQADLAVQVDKLFEKWDRTVSPGCALAVMKDGRVVYKRGYGMADLDHDVTITPATVFHVASISKQFTAAAILLLEQDGKLSVDDDVRKYIPELPDFGERITLRHLIHHTSGLRDQWDLLGLAGWRYSLDLITDDDVLAVMARQKDLNFKPGERHLYCNTGYTLLAQVVKRVSGQSFRAFTTARIFEPLGMKSTHFRDDHAEIVKGIGLRLCAGREHLQAQRDELRHRRRDEPADDRRGPGPLGRELLRSARRRKSAPREDARARQAEQRRRSSITRSASRSASTRAWTSWTTRGSDAGYRSDLLRFPAQHFSVAVLCNLSINPVPARPPGGGHLSRRAS